ncbi:MAG TPA: VOC family protein [Methylomirabilota bacterium]|nr:VOC family protein [Methylomirabilota bacterium]
MLELGQVVFGVRDLEAATRRMEGLGFTVLDGGVHPGLGTANRIVPLGRQYLELLGVVDERLAAASWYGRALLARVAGADRLVRWSLRTDAIDAVAAEQGLTPERRQRIRPDGRLLSWRAAGLRAAAEASWPPFFMQWDDPADFPGALPARHANGARGIAWLEVAAPDPTRLERWRASGAAPLRFIEGPPGLGRVAVTTPDGELLLGAA